MKLIACTLPLLAGVPSVLSAQYVFGRNGVNLPRTSRQQATVGRALAARVDSLKPGDLMVFSSKGVRIGKGYPARRVASRRVL